MMTAKEYFEAKKRMIQYSNNRCGIKCKDCPLYRIGTAGVLCREYEMFDPDKCISIVEQWEQEHPKTTYLSKVKDKFPDCLIGQLMINMCPGYFFVDKRELMKGHPGCMGNCEKCWNQLIP